jgi:hypothetical protein
MAYLAQEPESGHIVTIRITNNRSTPLTFQIEPSGDIASPLEPDASYVVVAQDQTNDYGTLDICIGDDGIRVWVEGRNGHVFRDGISEAC